MRFGELRKNVMPETLILLKNEVDVTLGCCEAKHFPSRYDRCLVKEVGTQFVPGLARFPVLLIKV